MSEPDNMPHSDRPRPCLALTMGDPAGVGPEVVLKSLLDARILRFMRPVVVGSAALLRARLDAMGIERMRIQVIRNVDEQVDAPDVVSVIDTTPKGAPEITIGKISDKAGHLAMQAVERAVDLCVEGSVDGMVTAPISKEAVNRAGYHVPGHTEYIADRLDISSHTMMMVAEQFRIGLVTAHIGIVDVPKAATVEAILAKLSVMDRALRDDFGIVRPRIAVLGLNPHAGDGGLIGREEVDTVVPAIKKACSEGYLALGPFPADGFFASGAYRQYDAVLAMYHDQGLIPFKVIAFDSGVNYTAGLPIVRTSPDHGTAFDIAGRFVARPDSMRSAIYLAVEIARRRIEAAS
jgi:4-hydroxythreonine-4-phosphate dehydrogenase